MNRGQGFPYRVPFTKTDQSLFRANHRRPITFLGLSKDKDDRWGVSELIPHQPAHSNSCLSSLRT
jgi:hypothetical protein